MSDDLDFGVHNLNALNRALPLIAKHRRSAGSADLYAAWLSATSAVQERRDWYRKHVANLCAPWFDGSAFPLHPDYRRTLAEMQEAEELRERNTPGR